MIWLGNFQMADKYVLVALWVIELLPVDLSVIQKGKAASEA